MRRLLILALMLWPAVAGATNYFVKPSGSNSNTGLSYAAAFQTLDKLSDSCNAAGDTGFIAPGEYDAASGNTVDWCDYSQDVTILLNHSGSAGNPIVFRSMHDSTRPTICGNRGVWNRYALASLQQRWIVVDSVIVKQAFRGMYFEGCDQITVQNCVVCSCFISGGGAHVDNNAGVMMGYCDNGDSNLISRCSVFTIAGWFNGSRYDGINHDGIQTYRTLAGNRFTKNVIWDCVEGIRMKSGLAVGQELDSNVIHDCSDNGIYGYGFDQANVHHNIIYDVNSQGIKPLQRGNANDSPIVNMKVWNNTVYHSDSAGFLFGDSEDTPPTSNDAGQFRACSVFNNIVVNSNGTSREIGTLPNIANTGSFVVIDSSLVLDWNNAFDPGTTTTYRWRVSGTNFDYTQAQMIANTVHADNSIYEYPGFVDTTVAGGYDLNISPSSASATGGRGGDYPSYMGALDPNVDVCVSIVVNAPVNNDTIEDYTPTLDIDLFDTDGDTATVSLYFEDGDATPDVLEADTVLVMDDDWVYTVPTLTENHEYYMQWIACDTSGCCDTSAVIHITMDSITAASQAPLFLYGTQLKQVGLK